MDLDGDGHDDMISGSYWPGDLFWFRGLGGGMFAAGAKLQDASGKDLNAGPEWKGNDKPEMDSLAAAPFAADLDGDGDFDLLVGNIIGHVVLIPNEGTPTEPNFVGAHRKLLEAAGAELRVDGDAGPTMADWNGDGLADLIVGAGDGAVSLYVNVGSRKEPKFAAAKRLLEPAADHGLLNTGLAPTRSGGRSKVCAADYDGDGQLDLLVGDFASVSEPEPTLSDEQFAEKTKLQSELQAIEQLLQKYDEQQVKPDDPRMQRANEKLSKVLEQLRPFQGGHQMHGWVWLYRGKAGKAAARN